jgi:membrane-bound serine protease (ClpP class)
MEELLINPNLAYIFLVGAFMVAGLALITPGTGVLEIMAVILLFLAGWELYNLPVNAWALLVIFIGFVLYLLAVRRKADRLFLSLAIAALVIGGWFLFRSDSFWQPAINPLLFIIVNAIAGGFLWVVTVKAVESSSVIPSHDLSTLIGSTGEARTRIYTDGSVQVNGELWSARSEEPIPNQSPVRVVGREGFVLLVEPVRHQDQ